MLLTKKYEFNKVYPLDKKVVWNLLSDTDRLNRFIGLFPVNFSNVTKDEKNIFYRDALAKVAGMVPLKWKEYPFEWVKDEYYDVKRDYYDGPLKQFIGGVELKEVDGGTNVRLYAEFTPRNVLGILAIPFTGVKSMHNTMKYVDEYLSHNHDESKSGMIPTNYKKPSVNISKLTRLEKLLKRYPMDDKILHFLHEYLLTESNQDVAEMRPYQLAKKWKVDEKRVLKLFLYATKVGILNLSWNLICPNCRVSKNEYTSLSQLQEQFHCDLCGVNYDANFDQYVELYFTVHPSIRSSYSQAYCVGGPMITPHINVQKVIKNKSKGSLKLPTDEKNMRMRILESNEIVMIQYNEEVNNENCKLIYLDTGWKSSSIEVGFQTKTLSIVNDSQKDIVVVIEEVETRTDVVTAAEVTAMQEFRDLFSSEILSPGQQVGIENVTILFSDLLGSTSMYESVGDAHAYGKVKRHFDFLTEWISKNSGSVVKTIGDAVMAVFYQPEDALKAAIDIQNYVSIFNEEKGENITLKIGLFNGPAIVVNSNDRLDYFGRTVNIAARIQAESQGNDIVIEEQLIEREQIKTVLTERNITPFTAKLKGISCSMKLIRIT
ncbi:adenylate/guanylate cyclase domain-containing protein [Bacillus sp. RD4P76]|uniref:Adenylate/guanylate cyclase domain-containing protein n=1 Tax=Bacillus suaedaesalsae TaxID=2810349 RepID=A0ABS2DF01_9BACI|nr:adenylate/guanylate cyclase domain-containing protein [Bacillus suaedaesalsae]